MWALIVGDPLLVGWPEVTLASTIGLLVVATVTATYKKQVLIGFDRDQARILGLRVGVYDWLSYTLLALTLVGLVRVVGFVLEHVLVLAPSAIALNLTKSSSRALILSVSLSVVAGATGLSISMLTNQAPAGVIGILLTIMYLLSLFWRRKG
jgi:ABC-type Mn2+/Zn2+ transport system permease subunit